MPGLELLVGVARHPGFGPVVLVGAGGTDAELRNDMAVLMRPSAHRSDAGDQRVAARAAPPRLPTDAPPPVDRLADVVHRCQPAGRRHPRAEQLDLNPVIVDTAGCVAVDARASLIDDVAPVLPLRGMRGHVGRPVVP